MPIILVSNREGRAIMSKYHFTTVVSSKYLYKALVMYQSLKEHCHEFQLFIMCVEEDIYIMLKDMELPNVKLLRIGDIYSEELEKAKNNRSFLEYCWTLKPVTLYHVLSNYSDGNYFAHVDADLCFFGNPAKIFREAPQASLYLVDHNNSRRFYHTYETSGRFNTGFVGCANNNTARKAVKWWRDKSLELCPAIPDKEKRLYGDQRYVERWLVIFEGVHILESKGVNVAVWNIDNYKVKIINKKVYVNNDQLIFYHFSGFSIIYEKEFSLTWFYPIKKEPLNFIYIPYMTLLSENIKKIKQRYPDFNKGIISKDAASKVHLYKL